MDLGDKPVTWMLWVRIEENMKHPLDIGRSREIRVGELRRAVRPNRKMSCEETPPWPLFPDDPRTRHISDTDIGRLG